MLFDITLFFLDIKFNFSANLKIKQDVPTYFLKFS